MWIALLFIVGCAAQNATPQSVDDCTDSQVFDDDLQECVDVSTNSVVVTLEDLLEASDLENTISDEFLGRGRSAVSAAHLVTNAGFFLFGFVSIFFFQFCALCSPTKRRFNFFVLLLSFFFDEK